MESNINLHHIFALSLSDKGIHSLATDLIRRESAIGKLEIEYHATDNDDSVKELTKIFCDDPRLTPKELSLCEISTYESGCYLIVRLLQDPICTMEENHLNVNDDINDIPVIIFAKSLAKNTTLKN